MSAAIQAELIALHKQVDEQEKLLAIIARRVALLEDPGLDVAIPAFPAELRRAGYIQPETTARSPESEDG